VIGNLTAAGPRALTATGCVPLPRRTEATQVMISEEPSLVYSLTTLYQLTRFQVFTAASIKIIAFWDIALCSLVEVDRRFRGAYCLHHRPDDGDSTHL
jgi:hypothetical protein